MALWCSFSSGKGLNGKESELSFSESIEQCWDTAGDLALFRRDGAARRARAPFRLVLTDFAGDQFLVTRGNDDARGPSFPT